MESYLLKETCVISKGQQQYLDVYIKNRLIEKIGSSLSIPRAKQIDCSGLFLLPNLIDDQVYFRKPRNEQKCDIGSENLVAVYDGVTPYLEKPNTNPLTDRNYK